MRLKIPTFVLSSLVAPAVLLLAGCCGFGALCDPWYVFVGPSRIICTDPSMADPKAPRPPRHIVESALDGATVQFLAAVYGAPDDELVVNWIFWITADSPLMNPLLTNDSLRATVNGIPMTLSHKDVDKRSKRVVVIEGEFKYVSDERLRLSRESLSDATFRFEFRNGVRFGSALLEPGMLTGRICSK